MAENSAENSASSTKKRKLNFDIDQSLSKENECPDPKPKFTRSQAVTFDWKKNCFICGKECFQKKRNTWSKIESSIDKNSKLFAQVLEAARGRNDYDIIARMLSTNGDLVSVEARYHRQKACLSQYISDRNNNYIKSTPEKSNYTQACELLKCEYLEPIAVQKCVYELSALKSRFLEIAEEKHLSLNSNMTTNFFKRVLQSNWPELRYAKRKGLTDIVFSQDLSVNEAVAYTASLETALNQSVELEDDFEAASNATKEDDISILHKAAVILRKRVTNTCSKTLKNEYYSAEEISYIHQKDFIDPVLLRFVNWLSSKSKVEEGEDILNTDVDKKVVAVASDLTALISPNQITPKHLGLSIHLHHTYGSKRLIEDLNVLGYTVSYSVVRRFLTSAALHMSNTQRRTPSGALVPTDVKSAEGAGTLMVAVADNWDHNENTLSGKNSTHAMTSILVVPPTPLEKRISALQNRSTDPSSLSDVLLCDGNKTTSVNQCCGDPISSHELTPADVSNRIPRVQDRSVDVKSLPGRGLSHVIPYSKPHERPQPSLYPPVLPEELKCQEPELYNILKLKDLMYNIGRCSFFCDDRSVQVPPWSIYHSHVETDVSADASRVLFNPILMANPTDTSTVYTTIRRAKEQMNALNQKICPIVFDMGLLGKALEIIWARKSEFDGVIPMEGGMHFLMACFAGIGFMYGEIGIKELLYESDVLAKKTADHILSGKDFDRGLRAILMLDEVLHNRFLINFRMWMESRNINLSTDLIKNIFECYTEREKVDTLLTEVQSVVVPLVEQFRAEGRHASALFQFWDDYLLHVSEPIKIFLAASRHSVWDAYHHSKIELLPFLFASNRSVYAKFMTYILLNMNRLPEEASESFRQGNFVAKLSSGVFNAVWFDYVLEVTENKSLKSSGGIIGITHNENAMVRWFLSRPTTAAYSMAFRGSSSDKKEIKVHHTDTKYFIENFNTDISKMNCMFEDTFIDPFTLSNPPSRLVNFATGVCVDEETEKSLLNSHREGRSMLDKFVQERLVINADKSKPSKSFFDPVPKSKVKVVKSASSSVTYKTKEIIIDGEEMYLRLLAINSFKKVPLERVMAFENAPIPISLFDNSGRMIANKKSDFMERLESLIDHTKIVKELPDQKTDAVIFDGMALMQMLQPSSSFVKPTYSDLAEIFWSYVLKQTHGTNVIHVVFDRYLALSVKAQTREKRGENSLPVIHIEPNVKVVDLKKILSSSKCKEQLTFIYTRYICEHAHEIVPSIMQIFVSGGYHEHTLRVQQDCITYIHELSSNHEEADTRMLLHVTYMGNEHARRVVLVSPDTDVLVLLAHHYFEMGVQEIYFKTGRTGAYANNTRYIPVHHIIEHLKFEQRQILLSVYCLSGCDSCSSFYGIGKKKAFKLVMSFAKDLPKVANLGTEASLTQEVKSEFVKAVGLLYGSIDCSSLNKLRTEMVRKNKKVKPKKLPPTDDSFILHLLRCTYQLLVWKGCLSAKQNQPDPLDYGYEIDQLSGSLRPQHMTQAAAAPELLSDLVCDCLDMCKEDCICSSNEQPCTLACECKMVADGNECCRNIFTALAEV